MPVTIKPRSSNTAAAVPTTAQLVDGEVAVNSADRIVYLRVGTSIVPVANYFDASAYVNVASSQTVTGGKTFLAGIAFGSQAAASATTLSKHIALFASTYGFSVTGGRLNYVVPSAATHVFVVNGVDIASVSSTGFSVTGDLVATGDIYASGTAFYGDGKEAIRFSDSWLRLNNVNDFASGTYFGTGIVRTDGSYQIGAGGGVFKADSTGISSNGDYLGPRESPFWTLTGNVTITAAHANWSFYNNSTTSYTLTNSTNLPPGTMFQAFCFGTGTITLAGAANRIFWWKGDGTQPTAGNRVIGRGGWFTIIVNPSGQWFVTGIGIS